MSVTFSHPILLLFFLEGMGRGVKVFQVKGSEFMDFKKRGLGC